MLTAAIIAAVASLAATGYGAYKSGQANKANRRILNEAKDENQREYIQEYNRGALDNPGSRAYLKRLESKLKDDTKAVENNADRTGATQENVLASKQANNRIMSDAVAGLVEKEDARKMQVKENYLQRKSNLKLGQMSQNSMVAQNYANIAQGVSSAAGSLASAYMASGGNSGGSTLGKTQYGLSRINGQTVFNYE